DDPTGAKSYAYPSLAVNANGDLFLTFASFSESQFASAEYIYVNAAGIPSTPALLKAGESAVVSTSRWGDYTTTIVDPVNGRDFWTLQMYATNANSWGTWWANFTLSPPKRRSARK
ncbi:MAG TPA: hypothetical protein VKB93_03070, partial [Thermoanaerobaculia bacterium]|nr:hypothetical protein [Thermoanaerobaculia bacterium]